MNKKLKEKIKADIESLLVFSPCEIVKNGSKGYLLIEINGVLRCYHIRSNLLTFEFNDQPLENIQVSVEVDDLIDKECDLKTITQSIAYANTLKKYSSLVNKINNKRKELENLEKKIERERNLLAQIHQKNIAASSVYSPKLKPKFTFIDEMELP